MLDYGKIDLHWHLPLKSIKLHKFKIRFMVQMSDTPAGFTNYSIYD